MHRRDGEWDLHHRGVIALFTPRRWGWDGLQVTGRMAGREAVR